jgi:hypothetical protein
VYRFAARLYRDPDEFRTHVQTFVNLFSNLESELSDGKMSLREAGAIILLISHGYFVVDDRPNKDPFLMYVRLVRNVMTSS